MELYYMIGVTERKKSQTLLDICKELNMPMVLTNLARGTATSEHLSLHNLDRSEKAVVSTVTDAAGVRRLMRQAKLKLYIDIPGNGIMMAIPLKSVAGGRTLAYLTGGKALEGGKPDMDFEYELIVVILNEGYSELVMDAARAAGARGGPARKGHRCSRQRKIPRRLAGAGKGHGLHRRLQQAEGGDHAFGQPERGDRHQGRGHLLHAPDL